MLRSKFGLGTLLRRLLELLDGDLEEIYSHEIPGYRPRYTPVLKALVDAPGSTIRDIALAACVSHSAASQTVSQMRRAGLLRASAGADARERRLWLSKAAQAKLPALRKRWALTAKGAASLEAEIGVPLADVLEKTIVALEKRSFRTRITSAP